MLCIRVIPGSYGDKVLCKHCETEKFPENVNFYYKLFLCQITHKAYQNFTSVDSTVRKHP